MNIKSLCLRLWVLMFRISDGSVFKNCFLWTKREGKSLFRELESLPGGQKNITYLILSKEALSLHEYIMKTYFGVHKKGSMERIFNYRLFIESAKSGLKMLSKFYLFLSEG